LIRKNISIEVMTSPFGHDIIFLIFLIHFEEEAPSKLKIGALPII